VVTHFGAMGLRSISANNRLILQTSRRLRSGFFVAWSVKRVSSSSRSSSANSFNSFSFIQTKTMRIRQAVGLFESSLLKWLLASLRLGGFLALANPTD